MEPFHGFDRENRRLTPLRLGLLGAATAILAPTVYISCLAAGGSPGLAVTIILALLVPAGGYATRVLPSGLPAGGRFPRVLFVVWLALAASAAYRVANLSVYMHDVTRTEFAMDSRIRESDEPEMMEPFFVRHNCFTCYVIAAELARDGAPNLYDPAGYLEAEHKTAVHRTIGDALSIDRYQYPPQFLLLPRLLLATGGDFFQIRTYWFAINVIALSFTAAALAAWVHAGRFGVCWLAWPILLSSPTTLATLQIGNAHLLVICMAILALLCFETKRPVIGGALLGFAVVSKIFPGLLLVYLLARRRWRDVGWTLAAVVAMTAAALAAFGAAPFAAFMGFQLPRIASGEAFSFAFEHIRPLTLNWSVMGVVVKMQRLGLLADIDVALSAKVVTWLYLGLAAAIAAAVGARHGTALLHRRDDRGESDRRVWLARIWLVLLILGQMRSPFLPWGYGGIPVLWLLLLFAPTSGPWLLRAAALALAYGAIATPVPLPYGRPRASFDLAYTLTAQLGVLALCLVLVILELRRASPMGWPGGVTRRASEPDPLRRESPATTVGSG